MTRPSLLAIFSLAAGVAFAQEPVEAPAELDGPVLTEDAGGLPGSPLLDATEVLAEASEAGGLLYLDPATAIDIISGYEKALAQRPGSAPLIADLSAVREELASGEPDGAIISAALLRLGEATVATAENDAGGNYAVLGEALKEAGNKLGGGE